MIYICEGCKQILLLPCTLCKCCGELFEWLCKSCSDACKSCCASVKAGCASCCGAIREVFSPILDNPLASYVLGSWVTFILTIVFGGASAYHTSNKCTSDSHEKQDLYIANLAMIGSGLIHAGFSIYIQRALVAGINAEGNENKTVSDVTCQLLKYDIPFCLYVFVGYCGGIAVVIFAGARVTGDTCDATAQMCAGGAIAMNSVFHICAFFYFCCFVCGHSVKDKTKKKGKKGEDITPIGDA